MHTPGPRGILAFTSLCAVLLLASACGSKKDSCNVCNAQTVGNVCQPDCPEGDYSEECIDQGGTYSCGLPAPCDEGQHCATKECYRNVDCSFSKCRYSKQERNAGLYACSDTACCLYSNPSDEGDDCTGGSCDGEGNCVPTPPAD